MKNEGFFSQKFKVIPTANVIMLVIFIEKDDGEMINVMVMMITMHYY